MSDADKILLLSLVRQVQLQQVATWILRDLLHDLEELRDDLGLLILKANPTGTTRPSARLSRVANLRDDMDEAVRSVVRAMAARVEGDMVEAGDISEEEERRNWLIVAGVPIAFEPKPTGVAGKPTALGARVRDAFDRVGDDLSYRVMAAVRAGVASEQSAPEIAATVTGRESGPAPRPPLTKQTASQVEAVVRTASDSVATETQVRAHPEDSKIGPHGWQHVSVLDSRTTEICRARAWRVWDADYKPVGHSMKFEQPPLHINCRSRIVMVMLDESRAERITFKQMVDRLKPSERDKLFGAERVRLWRAGKLTDADLIRQQNRPMTLEQLRADTEAMNSQEDLPF